MSWISKIFKSSTEGLVKSVGGIIDEFHLSDEEKQQFQLQLESLMQKHDSEVEGTIRAELQAKERVLVAELTQGDKFTKRARPSVVYVGLAVIVFNYCVVPTLLKLISIVAIFTDKAKAFETIGWQPLSLPVEFWVGWSGIVATWSIGRSAERRGVRNKVVQAITGSKLLPVLMVCLVAYGLVMGA